MYLQVCLQFVILARNIFLCNQGRRLRRLQASGHTDCAVHCVTLWLLYVGRPGETSDTRLLQLWTKAAMMLDWGSSTLDITTAGIVGVSYWCTVLCVALCWCSQCLLTVGGNWLLHTVTPLDVSTVVWCCRQTQDVLHRAECPRSLVQQCKHQSDSGQQVSLLPHIALDVAAVCLLKCGLCNTISHRGLAVGPLTADKCAIWHSESCYTVQFPCRSVFHVAKLSN